MAPPKSRLRVGVYESGGSAGTSIPGPAHTHGLNPDETNAKRLALVKSECQCGLHANATSGPLSTYLSTETFLLTRQGVGLLLGSYRALAAGAAPRTTPLSALCARACPQNQPEHKNSKKISKLKPQLHA